jgi:hypothetical protein
MQRSANFGTNTRQRRKLFTDLERMAFEGTLSTWRQQDPRALRRTFKIQIPYFRPFLFLNTPLFDRYRLFGAAIQQIHLGSKPLLPSPRHP